MRITKRRFSLRLLPCRVLYWNTYGAFVFRAFSAAIAIETAAGIGPRVRIPGFPAVLPGPLRDPQARESGVLPPLHRGQDRDGSGNLVARDEGAAQAGYPLRGTAGPGPGVDRG